MSTRLERLTEYQRQMEKLVDVVLSEDGQVISFITIDSSPSAQRTLLVLLELAAEETGGMDAEEQAWSDHVRELLDRLYPDPEDI